MFRKKVLAYSSNATGTAKLEEISAAYVEIIEDFQQKALQQGSEDPACAEMLQKCEELLPGQVKPYIVLVFVTDSHQKVKLSFCKSIRRIICNVIINCLVLTTLLSWT